MHQTYSGKTYIYGFVCKLFGCFQLRELLIYVFNRHYYMKDVNIVVPDPSKEKSVIAVSALAREMRQTNKVAIVRCVWRNGQGNVVVGVLTPNVSERDDTVSY